MQKPLLLNTPNSEFSSGEVFGTRTYLNNNYLYRMAAAVLGIYGNAKGEAMYPFYAVDEVKRKPPGVPRVK